MQPWRVRYHLWCSAAARVVTILAKGVDPVQAALLVASAICLARLEWLRLQMLMAPPVMR